MQLALLLKTSPEQLSSYFWASSVVNRQVDETWLIQALNLVRRLVRRGREVITSNNIRESSIGYIADQQIPRVCPLELNLCEQKWCFPPQPRATNIWQSRQMSLGSCGCLGGGPPGGKPLIDSSATRVRAHAFTNGKSCTGCAMQFRGITLYLEYNSTLSRKRYFYWAIWNCNTYQQLSSAFAMRAKTKTKKNMKLFYKLSI